MPYCQNCGTQILEEANFCSNCGQNISQITVMPPYQQPYSESTQPIKKPKSKEQSKEKSTKESRPHSKNNKHIEQRPKWMIPSVISIIIIIIIAIVAGALLSGKKENEENNITNQLKLKVIFSGFTTNNELSSAEEVEFDVIVLDKNNNGVDNALVTLSVNIGNFDESSGTTYLKSGRGYFSTSYKAPIVKSKTEITITARARKQGYELGYTTTSFYVIPGMLDTDKDGTPDEYDLDDDNDGYSDTEEIKAGTDPKDALDHPINNPPTATFTYSPGSPLTNEEIRFDASDSSDIDGTIESYSWDFGNGNEGSGKEITHEYSDDGRYTVLLTIKDDENAISEDSMVITVENRPPIATFTYSPRSPLTNEEIKFDASDSSDTDGTIQSYSWDFGDDSIGSGKISNHKYTAEGTYTITLEIIDNDGAIDSVSIIISVNYQTSYYLIPIDDAYVDSDDSDSNYGYDSSLTLKYWDSLKVYALIFLKFDLSSIPKDSIVESANLLMYCYYGGDNFELIGVWGNPDISWNEETITYLNAPIDSDESEILDNLYAYGADTYYIWDITNYVQNHKGEVISLFLFASTDTGYISFWSKDCSYCDITEIPILNIEIS